MKPHIHAELSVKQFGGKPSDYMEIHRFLDSSKGVISDHRHRALTHNSWFILNVLPRVFGYSIKNSDGKEVSVQDIGEQHVLEDFRGKFIPSAQDFLIQMNYPDWMKNGDGSSPPSSSEGPTTRLLEQIWKTQPIQPSLPPTPHWPPQTPPLENPFDHDPWLGGGKLID